MDALAAILPQLQTHPTTALERLLKCWADAPNARLAAAIEKYGAWASASLPALRYKTVRDHELAWLEIASRGRAVDIERLGAGLARGYGRKLRLKFDQLLNRPPDPRLTTHLLALVNTDLTNVAATGWVRLAAHGRDPRLWEALPRQADPYRQKRSLSRRLGPWPDPPPIDEDALAAFEAAVDRCVAAPSPPEDAFTTPEPAISAADLYAALLDDPRSIEAAHVWCDAMIEEGDPWAELTALQLKRETRGLDRKEAATERALLKRLGPSRLGRLAAIVAPRPLRFRRGLLDAASVRIRDPAHEKLLADPMFRSLRQLRSTPAHLTRPDLVCLERAGFGFVDWGEGVLPKQAADASRPPIEVSELLALAEHPTPLSITGAAVGSNPYEDWALPEARFRELDGLPGLPHLRELHLRGDETIVERILQSPLARRMREITVEGASHRAGPLFAALDSAGSLETLVLFGFDQRDAVRVRKRDGAIVVDVSRPRRFSTVELEGLDLSSLRVRLLHANDAERAQFKIRLSAVAEVVHLDRKGAPIS